MFVKKGVVIGLGGAGEVDDTQVYYPTVIVRNDKTYCYYSAHDGVNYRVALAISEDGLNFVKKGVVIGLGGAGEVDDTQVYYPTVIVRNDKTYCYYSASDGVNRRVALAISEDGM